MLLNGLDEIDQKILDLLLTNARSTLSEIGDTLGISRVAVKNHMDALEEKGIIEGYTVIINPQKMNAAVSVFMSIETKPDAFKSVVNALNQREEVTQIYRVSGRCSLHVHAVFSNNEALDSFLRDFIDSLDGITDIQTEIILSRIKDIKGLRL